MLTYQKIAVDLSIQLQLYLYYRSSAISGTMFQTVSLYGLILTFFFAASLYYRRSVRATSCKLIAKKKKWNGKWMEILVENDFFFYFHFIPRFDIHPNTYSAISIVNVHQICNINQKYTFIFFSCKMYPCVISPWWKVIETIKRQQSIPVL